MTAMSQHSTPPPNLSEIPVDRIYSPENTSIDYLEDLGFPGEYPFTRGIQPTMYRGRLWTMRQYSGYASAEDTNRRFKFLLSQGQTGLSVAFDLPTQTGYDSDARMAEGEVGKVGVPISSLQDMERLFDGIPLDRVSTSMTINATAPILLALYVAVAKKQGAPNIKIRGTTQNDILKEYIARGTYIYPPRESLRLTIDVIEYCARELAGWNPISISGYHIREAGATAVQEVAFTFANAIEYVSAALARGLQIDEFAPQLSFFFVAQMDFLQEIAKFRAARRLWASLVKNKFGARDPRSMMLRFHTQTAGVSLTAQQPENNIVRTAIEALAAVLGGTQSLHTNSYDEALALPTEQSAKIALRTQQIIGYESGVTNTIDPVAGSFYIEHLTDEIVKRAAEYLQQIEKLGGAQRAIETGFINREIQESAWQFQKAVDDGTRTVVGVNQYATAHEVKPRLARPDPTAGERQKARLRELRATRDAARWGESLRVLENAARGNENLMPYIITAVEADATVGEISDALRRVFGEYRGNAAF